MQENIFLPVTDTKIFSLTESKPSSEKKVPQDQLEACRNYLENSMSVDIIRPTFYRKKTKFENIFLPFIL